jgi:hypothetical protein
MFLAAVSLERTAEAGRFLGADAADAAALADIYSSDWRHGMTGDWPLYVPGFFAMAIATVLWSRGRTIRSQLAEGSLALLLALLAARLLAPMGARWIIASFEQDTGLALLGSPVGAMWSGAVAGVLTVVSWAALMVAVQISVTRRSIWPLLAPLACYSALAVLRPGEAGELMRPWAEALWDGDAVAIISTALMPPIAAILWWWCVRSESIAHEERGEKLAERTAAARE